MARVEPLSEPSSNAWSPQIEYANDGSAIVRVVVAEPPVVGVLRVAGVDAAATVAVVAVRGATVAAPAAVAMPIVANAAPAVRARAAAVRVRGFIGVSCRCSLARWRRVVGLVERVFVEPARPG
jgi:hypothetical protein